MPGRTTRRGYGTTHQKERARWARTIKTAGSVPCARCGQPITTGMAWHLDHTADRTAYLGPSHATCNSRAGGQVPRVPRARLPEQHPGTFEV